MKATKARLTAGRGRACFVWNARLRPERETPRDYGVVRR